MTGAGLSSLASTEDAGWLTPVPAREALARSTAALAPTQVSSLCAATAPSPLLLAFDLSTRTLLGHTSLVVAGSTTPLLPFAWVGAGSALEAEINDDSTGLWQLAMAPDQAHTALSGPLGARHSGRPAAAARLLSAGAPSHHGLGLALATGPSPLGALEQAPSRPEAGPRRLKAPLHLQGSGALRSPFLEPAHIAPQSIAQLKGLAEASKARFVKFLGSCPEKTPLVYVKILGYGNVLFKELVMVIIQAPWAKVRLKGSLTPIEVLPLRGPVFNRILVESQARTIKHAAAMGPAVQRLLHDRMPAPLVLTILPSGAIKMGREPTSYITNRRNPFVFPQVLPSLKIVQLKAPTRKAGLLPEWGRQRGAVWPHVDFGSFVAKVPQKHKLGSATAGGQKWLTSKAVRAFVTARVASPRRPAPCVAVPAPAKPVIKPVIKLGYAAQQRAAYTLAAKPLGLNTSPLTRLGHISLALREAATSVALFRLVESRTAALMCHAYIMAAGPLGLGQGHIVATICQAYNLQMGANGAGAGSAKLLGVRALPLKRAQLQPWALAPVVGVKAGHVPSPRLQPSPSLVGLGLDEGRLVRSGGSRLWDPALVNAKPASLATPQTTLPLGPLSLLSLAWSSNASLSSYPSFKCARGGLLRRPLTGARAHTPAVSGLKEGLASPLLGKTGSVLGRPHLGLWALDPRPRPGVGTSADAALLRWAPTWAFFGPAPAEDLDPGFVNTTWTPEINTTRRSDHNSRYKVTWAPLASSLTSGASLGAPTSGPQVRGALSPLGVRRSLLALHEAGLKNHQGLGSVRAQLAHSPVASRQQQLGEAAVGPHWPLIWSFAPALSENTAALVGAPANGAWVAGRAASTLSLNNAAKAHGGLSSLLAGLGSGNGLVNLLAISAFTNSTGPDRVPSKAQGYVPLSSSLSASRRLRVTKGITLPSDVPMHVICGSKDVIHS